MKDNLVKITLKELEDLRQMKREFERLKRALRVTYKIVKVPVDVSFDDKEQIEYKEK